LQQQPMNNGEHLSILDVARLDLLIRGRIASHLSAHGWYPVVVAETIHCHKSLKLFQTFFVETAVLGWDEKAFILQQRFWRQDVCVAEAVVRARVLKRTGGPVSPMEMLRAAGVTEESQVLPEWIRDWNARQSD
jgi:acyl-CoA thioesterase FadM